MEETAMEDLERKLEYVFHRRGLLAEALSHSSYANEHRAAGTTRPLCRSWSSGPPAPPSPTS